VARDRRLLRLFAREACIMAQLAHPNIIPIHDIGTDRRGNLYFIMKTVQGHTLRQRVETAKDRLDRHHLLDTIEILFKVCDALAFAHQRGVIHCDIKPENVMIGNFGAVYVMDWGVARILGADNSVLDPPRMSQEATELDPDNTDFMVMGTPSFMAPEQARGERSLVDARTDVFAVGALLYFVLTGRGPHHGETATKRLMHAQCTTPTRPSESVKGIPPFLEDIVMRAVSLDQADRYPSIEALRSDLQVFVRDGAEFPLMDFRAGEVIIHEGSMGDAAYVIETGRCEVRRTVDGVSKQVRVMGPGEGFGETAILTDTERSATVVALEACTLRYIARQRIEAELEGMRPWMRAFMHTLAGRFRDL
jgi:serine/threonine-protein kinase